MTQFTMDDLKQIMRECAGEDESVDLDGEIGATRFDDLGYDSLALLETASRVEREFDVPLPDGVLAEVDTPFEFVALVNLRLADKAVANA
jgi:minimal PKS acyl carrier protein